MARPVIFFDWDGTLCDSMDLCIEECRQALLEMGLPDLPNETLRKCNGPNDWDACEILGVPEEMKAEYVHRRVAAGLALLPTVNKLFPGVREMLARLSEVADLAIVSNGQQEYLDLCQQVFGLEGVFVRTQGFTPGKTKSDLLGGLIDDLKPELAVMVGDRLGDLVAGRDQRLCTVAACFGYGNDAEYAHADIRCNTVEALGDWLYRFAAGTLPLTRVYFVRHAQPKHDHKDDRTRPLTAEGRADAAIVLQTLRDKQIDAFYCSPYLRSMDTIREAAAWYQLPILTDERLRERQNGPDGNVHGLFQKRWADHDLHEEGGESLNMVAERNIAALQQILADNPGRRIVIGTHGTALSTIIHHYRPAFGCDDFLRIIDWMPYIVELAFDGQALVSITEHAHVYKEFKGVNRPDKKH